MPACSPEDNGADQAGTPPPPLNYGLAVILAFIGVKLGLHWAHLHWESIPEIPTLLSLGVIVGVLALTTLTSHISTRDRSTKAVSQEESGKAG